MTNVKKNNKRNKLKSTFRKKNKNLRTSSIKNNKSKYKKKDNRKKQKITIQIKNGGGGNGLSSKQLVIKNPVDTSKTSKDNSNKNNNILNFESLDKLTTEQRKEQLLLIILLINEIDSFNTISISTTDNVPEIVKKVKTDTWDKMDEAVKNYFIKNKLDLNKHYSSVPIDPYKMAKELRDIFQEDKPGEKKYYGLNKQAKLDMQELLYKLVGKDNSGKIPSKFDKDNENHKIALDILDLITDKYDFKKKAHKSCTIENNIKVLAEFINALNKLNIKDENIGWKKINESLFLLFDGLLPELKEFFNKYDFDYNKINKMKHKMSGKEYNPKEKITEAQKKYTNIFLPIWRDKERFINRKSKLIDIFDELEENIKDDENDKKCLDKIKSAREGIIKVLDDKFKSKAPLPDSDKAAKIDLSKTMNGSVDSEDGPVKKDVAVLHLKTLKEFITDIIKLKKNPEVLESTNKSFNKLPKQIKEKFISDGFAYENLYKTKSVGLMKSGKTKKADKIYKDFKETYLNEDGINDLTSLIDEYKDASEKVEEEETKSTSIETQTEVDSKPETTSEQTDLQSNDNKITKDSDESSVSEEPETEHHKHHHHKHHHKEREDIDGNPLPKLKEDEHYVKHHGKKHGKKYYSIEKYDSNKPYKSKDGKDLPKLKKGQHYIHHHDGSYSIENYKKTSSGGGKNEDLDKEIEEIKESILTLVKKQKQKETSSDTQIDKSSSASESSSIKSEVIGEPISSASVSGTDGDLVQAVHGVEDAVRNKNSKSSMTKMMTNMMGEEKKPSQIDCPPPPDMKSITITAPAGYNIATEGSPDMNNKISGMKAVLSNKGSAPHQEAGGKKSKKYRRFKLRKRTRRINRQKKNVRKN